MLEGGGEGGGGGGWRVEEEEDGGATTDLPQMSAQLPKCAGSGYPSFFKHCAIVNYGFKIALCLVKYACVSTRLNYFLVMANIFFLNKKGF